LQICVDGRDHKVDVHHRFDVGPDCGAGLRAKCNRRNKVPVHHVDVYPVRALRFNGFDLCTEVGKIRSED